MNDDKSWGRIVDAIDIKFGISKHGREERQVADARDLNERVSFITFERAGETYKIERVVGPAILDRRTIGSRRIGSDVRFENVYDRNETTAKTRFYKEVGDEWQEISPDSLGL